MEAQPIVLTRKLCKTYGGDTPHPVQVLRGVDMQVQAGEFVAVIGQSGSGKSTLLNILGALDRPTTGQALIDGTDIGSLNGDALAALRSTTIGFIFQSHYLLDEFTCEENALMPLAIRHRGIATAEVLRVRTLLQRVGLDDQLRKFPRHMSGGQQQRTAIIRALANQPKLVLADEPTGNLDAHAGQEVFQLMHEMARETGVAFVMVTHDDRMAGAADRILRIEDGLLQELSQDQVIDSNRPIRG